MTSEETLEARKRQMTSEETLEAMKDECRQKIGFEIESHENMIKALKNRLKEVENGDLHTIISMNYTLQHQNHKVKK